MTSGDASQQPTRALLAAGTRTYRHGAEFTDRLSDLEAVPGELRSIIDTLTGLGYAPRSSGTEQYMLDPEVGDLRDAIRAAAQAAPLVVVYYTGHGLKPERSPFYLLTADSEQDRLEDTALEPSQFLTLAQRKEGGSPAAEQPQVLVILDCCFSGAGGGETLRDSLQDLGNPNVWVLASAGEKEWAEQGVFVTAFTSALRRRPATGHSQESVSLDWIAGEINAALRTAGAGQTARLILPRGETTGIYPAFFENKEHVPGVAGLTVDDQAWVSRLRGAPEESTTAGFYVTGHTGRVRVVDDLARWMRDPDSGGLAVVTGSPGCGKSAMLALPVLLTDTRHRDTLLAGERPNPLAERAAELFAGLRVFGVYARGLDPYKIVDSIAQHLGRSVDSAEELLKDLEDHPETSSQIIVIDALDEARDPQGVLNDLLLPLTRRPGMRVVLGTRRNILPPPAATSLLVDLDTDNYRDPEALTDYAHQLLLATREPGVQTPYQDSADDVVAMVAAGIAAKAIARPTARGQAESFLLTQLLARAVRGRDHVLDVTDNDWADELPDDVGTAFDKDLSRLKAREPATRALLTALAWAKGPGLPWESIWVPVARAVAAHTETGTPDLNDDDVRWLLDNAGAYVAEDIGPGQRSAFRPFHELLATHLRPRPNQQQTTADPTAVDEGGHWSNQVEEVISRALLDTIRTAPDGEPDWDLAHPYLRTYLAQHAHAAGPDTFAELVANLDFLAAADPVTLTPLLTPNTPHLVDTSRVYRRARPLLGNDAHDNLAYLEEARLAVMGRTPLAADELGGAPALSPSYFAEVTVAVADQSLLLIREGSKCVGHLRFQRDRDGTLLLATGGTDGRVQVWDPMSGKRIADLPGLKGDVRSLQFLVGAKGDLALLASGSDAPKCWEVRTGATVPPGSAWKFLPVVQDQSVTMLREVTESGVTVRLLESGTPVLEADLPDADDSVLLRLCGRGADGVPFLVTVEWEDLISCWSPPGERVWSTKAPMSVYVIAVAESTEGGLLLAAGGTTGGAEEGAVRLFDTAYDSTPKFALSSRGATSIALGCLPDGTSVLAVGTREEQSRADVVLLLDAHSGRPIGGPLRGHTDEVLQMVFAADDEGMPLLITSSYDGYVRRWRVPSGEELWPPIIGHGRPVTSLAFGTDAEGQPVLATASSPEHSGVTRLWNPATGHQLPLSPLLDEREVDVAALCWAATGSGVPLLVIGHWDGRIMRYAMDTGNRVGDPLRVARPPVRALAYGVDDVGNGVIAAGDGAGNVHRWNSDGRPLDGPTPYHQGATGVTATVSLRDAGGHALLATAGDDARVIVGPLTPDAQRPRAYLRRSAVRALATSPGLPDTFAVADHDGVSVISLSRHHSPGH